MTDPIDPTLSLNIDRDRVIGELKHLATFSECPDPPPAVTRIVFSKPDLEARKYLRSLYEQTGLQVRVDSIGNTFARWTGTEPHASVIGTGSHCDAIPFSGMYDGTVGVLGGLEAIRSLQSAGFVPRRSIELLMITSEEPTRFGIGCLGSRVMAGSLTDQSAANLTDDDDRCLDDVRQEAGFDGTIESSQIRDDYYHRWVELHIEQGPILEKEQFDIGVVTAIAAPATMQVTVIGNGGHAGAVQMSVRRDALCAASELILAIEHTTLKSVSDDVVATVGRLEIHPGAINSIPSRVTFTIDLRDIEESSRDDVKTEILDSTERIAKERDVKIDVQTRHEDPPATCANDITDAIEVASRESQLTCRRMVSRAYHDSLFLARKSPIGMIFIPCHDGVSHRPDEYSTPQQIANGVEVLARTLAKLASRIAAENDS